MMYVDENVVHYAIFLSVLRPTVLGGGTSPMIGDTMVSCISVSLCNLYILSS